MKNAVKSLEDFFYHFRASDSYCDIVTSFKTWKITAKTGKVSWISAECPHLMLEVQSSNSSAAKSREEKNFPLFAQPLRCPFQ